VSKQKPQKPQKPQEQDQWALPIEVEADKLVLRLDFHEQSLVLTEFGDRESAVRLVSPRDMAFALAKELAYGTDILPEKTLWWQNTSAGEVIALWEPPQVWKVALAKQIQEPPRRLKLPMPGLIFLCRPGLTPWVYAAKKRPKSKTDTVYKAPLCNVFENGKVCAGNHQFPVEIAQIPSSFFMSFFTASADISNRSVKHPTNIVKLWEELDGKADFPLDDLVPHGKVNDLIRAKLQ
jgi:PRTRC genetic system protein B